MLLSVENLTILLMGILLNSEGSEKATYLKCEQIIIHKTPNIPYYFQQGTITCKR